MWHICRSKKLPLDIMRQFLRIAREGAAQAWGQLVANKLRSFLSLLGVTIGIFCIIGVTSAVDSLESNIRNSMKKLGNDVVYIEKFSWGEDPGQNYWKWMRRPNFSFKEFEALQERLTMADKIGFWQFLGAKTAKWRSSSVEDTFFLGITDDCNDLFHLEFEGDGRFFSSTESQSGADVCVIGKEIALGLFGPEVEPLDREIQVGGRKLRVVGVLKKSGKDLIQPFNFDECVLVSYTLARRGFNVRRQGQFDRTSLSVKARPGIDLEELKDEVTSILRAQRRIHPREENNFALNTLSIISSLFDSVFGVMNLAGGAIGIFALLVGMFSVANIMFVSVRERTNLIGIKMALGAKRWFILLEILVEAVLLCLAGGILGLALIWGVTAIISKAIDFEIFLSLDNILLGMGVSVFVGVVSGLIPALQASRMDPVEAIRK
jgi:putative ABC transport system permease protein